MKKIAWAAGAVGLALLAGGAAWWWNQKVAAEALQFRSAKIERGSLQATVSASGAVNPVTQVSVGTQVSGQIKDLYVDFNSEVKAGQLIAVIDPETFEYRVRSAQADVDAARAAVLTAQAGMAASRAAVSRARVDLVEAQRDLERKQSLVERQFIAQSEADKARALVNTSTESVKSAEAQVGVTEAQVKSAQAGVAQRESALAQARIDLGRTRITSPVNGIVIKRAIEKGQTVAASLQAPELFVIAQNLQDMQVDASIDESDVGRIRTGQKASFTVDAFPGQTFTGEVRQVRKAAQNVANVVTYVAVVGFVNTGGRLLPGMTANVRVVTDSRENVLKVPNAALRVRIAGIEPAAAASAPGLPASAAATGNARGWSWLSEAQAQPAGGPGGALAAQRERLVSALELNLEQQARLDAIGVELRPRFMGLRELGEDERAAAREKVMADMRGRINAMLEPGQKARYAQLLAQQGGVVQPAVAPRGPDTAAPQTRPVPEPGAAQRAASSAAGTQALNSKPSTPATSASQSTPVPMAAAAPAASGAAGAAPQGGVAAALAVPPGPAGQLTEFRNRLVSELAMTVAQAEQVDTLTTEARPRFMQLRDLPAEERGRARERIMADMRARIGDLLTPVQKAKYATLLAESAGRSVSRGRIYILAEDGKPRAFNVRLGITDGTSTELMSGSGSPDSAEIKEGVSVVVGIVTPGAASGQQKPAAGPRMPF